MANSIAVLIFYHIGKAGGSPGASQSDSLQAKLLTIGSEVDGGGKTRFEARVEWPAMRSGRPTIDDGDPGDVLGRSEAWRPPERLLVQKLAFR